MQYRREIDGLRAVAVIPVVLFHAGFASFSGGFVGVDVFFVISGYLITRTLSDDIERGEFSLTNFYEARIRRILPALFFVILMLVPLAWLFLLPNPMILFGQSIIHTVVFASNYFFFHQQGYFSGNSALQPLLHTWSLAVEEQFYLIFPVVLATAIRFGKRTAFSALCVLAVASFLYSQYGVATSPETKAAFYLAPSRAWELFAGSICAFVGTTRPGRGRGFLGLIGLAAIFASIALYDETTPFPGAHAALPVVGTCLILLFADRGTLVARLLSRSPLVGIGLVSYSAYLWHQPLLAFARIRSVTEPSLPVIGGVLALTFVLAYLTWRYVEKPFRRRNGMPMISRSSVFRSAGSVAAALIVIGFVGQQDEGLKFRYSPQEQALLESSDFHHSMIPSGFRTCFIDYDQKVDVLLSNKCVPSTVGPRVIVFGDSEAAHLMTGIRAAFGDRGYEIGEWAATGCRPFSYAHNSRRCIDFIESFWKDVSKTLRPDDIVIVGANWSSSLDELGEQEFLSAIRAMLTKLSLIKGQVLIVGDVPNFAVNPPIYVVQTGQTDRDEIYLEPRAGSVGSRSNSLVADEAKRLKLGFIDPSPQLCRSDPVLACAIKIGSEMIFFDGNHLSDLGSAIMGEYIKPFANRTILPES